MLFKALFAFIHFAAAFTLAAALFYEWMTFSKAPSLAEARRIAWADRAYGMSAGIVIVAGLLRANYFEKGWAFYTASPFFIVKMALFVLIAVLSIYPTIRFIRWGRDIKAGRAPAVTPSEYSIISTSLRLQLVLLIALLASASLMASGVLR